MKNVLAARTGIVARAVLAVALLGGGLGVVSAPVASAAGANITLVEHASSSVLYGAPSTVTLDVSNVSSPAVNLYNVSLGDVLPVGVSYVAGSSTLSGAAGLAALGDPTVYANEPATGQTTLVWSNVADLLASSSESLSFSLQAQTDSGPHAGTTPILPGASYSDASAVYANTDPRYAPQFNSTTGAVVTGTTSYTDTASSSGTTRVSAIAVATSEPSPKLEILRGVHDHQVDYSVVVTNNAVHSTSGTSVNEFLPAGLEFLGCGAIDNTTTGPEYPGSGSLAVGTALSTSACPTPVSVTTVSNPTTLSGPLSGIYTEVTWNLGTLSAGQVQTLHFVAGVPLRQNALFSGTPPSPTSLGQAANLDNNTGPETYDGEVLTTVADATGVFAGSLATGTANPVSAEGTDTSTAVDLAQWTSESPSSLVAGQVVDYTLHYATSEYRYTTGAVLASTVPSGLCPLGLVNYATDTAQNNCAPTGAQPTTTYSAVSENANGSFALSWNLGTLAPNTIAQITYPAMTRPYYENTVNGSVVPTTPLLISDTVSDTSSITGTVNGTCYTGTPSSPTPDPTCTGSPTSLISAGEATPSTPTRGDSAVLTAAVPTLTKTIAAPVAPGTAINCATSTYVSSSTPATTPTYVAGDTICFRLQVSFPAGVYAHDPSVTDFLPPNTTYVSASAAPMGDNTVTIASTTDAATTPDSLSFTLGNTLGTNPGLYTSPGQVFDVTLAVLANAAPSSGNNYSQTANLMTLSALDTQGQSVSLRDQATYYLTQPVLSLAKTVALVNGSTPGATVRDGDQVTYDVTLTNTGLVTASNTVAWDNLPSQVTSCSSAVSTISDAGACASASQIQWSGITVPAATFSGSTLVPGTKTLSYVMTVPATAAAGETLTNRAGVVSYQGPNPNNLSATPPANYYPASNIDATVTPNAPRADATAAVSLASPSITKSAVPSVNGQLVGGNPAATVGEPVLYTVDVNMPAGTSYHSGTVSDPLGSQLTYSATPSPASATIGGTDATTLGFSLSTSANTVSVTFPSTYSVTTATTLVLTYYAVVQSATAGTVDPNTATFTWNDLAGSPSSTTASAQVTVITPHLVVTKSDSPGGPYDPGTTVTYTVSLTNNGTDASAAYAPVITDTLPTGITSPTCTSTPAGWNCAVNGTTSITWTLSNPSLPANGATTSFQYTVVTPSPVVGSATLSNTASISATSLPSGSYPGAQTYTASATDTVLAAAPSISKTESPTSVTNGVDTTYTATVVVPAGVTLPNFTILDTLPNGMTFDGYGANASYTCTDTVGSCGSDVQTQSIGTPSAASNGTTALGWWIGNLTADSGVRTITVNYQAYPSEKYANGTPVTPTNLTNDVTAYWSVTSASGAPTSIPTAASFASPNGYSTSTATSVVAVIAPHLNITKVASTTKPVPSTPFTYTITVRNTGADAAYGTTVSDPLPASLDWTNTSISSTSAGSATFDSATGTVQWDLSSSTVAPSATVTLVLTTQLAASSTLSTNQSIANTSTINQYYGVAAATALATPSRYDAYGPTNATANVTATMPMPVPVKTAPVGTNATIGSPFEWRVTTEDSTTAPANNATMTDVLPADWTYTPGTNSTTITQASGTTVSGPGADPSVSVNNSTHVTTLTWSGAQLSGLHANAANSAGNAIVVTYTATPQLGASVTGTNTATVAVQDLSGATGNATGPYQASTTKSATIISADLSIAKTLVGSGVVPGAQATYDLNVANAGPSAAANPQVSDTLPTGETYVSASGTGWSCSGVGQLVTCNATSALAAGSSASTIALVVKVASGYLATTISNTATVTSTSPDPVSSNNTSTLTSTSSPSADVAITKTNATTLVSGTTDTYTLGVANAGPSDAANLVVSDTLPAGETFVSASGTNWSCSAFGQLVTCDNPSMVAGTNSPISLDVTLASNLTGTVTNSASVSCSTSDPNSANNSATDVATVATSADLSIVKSAVGSFVAGSNATYTLSVANAGPSDAAAPTVTDALPTGETFVSASGTGWNCSAVGQLVTCDATGPLTAATSASPITLVVALASNLTGTVTNSANVSSSTSDPNGANNTNSATSSVTTSADLSIVKSLSGAFVPGTSASYILSVANAGPSDAAAPTVTDTLPTGETFVSASGTGWNCSAVGQLVTCAATSTLAANTTASAITLAVTLASGVTASLANTASVSSSTSDPNLTNNTASVSSSPTPGADLAITTNGVGTLVPGADFTYTLNVTNAGPSDAAAPTVTDTLPTGETFVSASGTGWNCSAVGQLVTCDLTSPLVVGAHAPTITLVVATASDLTSSVSDTATVSSTTTDPVPSNNASTAVESPVASADLALVKTAVGSFVAGRDATYSLAVTNAGPSDAAAATLTDTLPTGETFVSASGTGWSCSAVGQLVTCDASATLTAGNSVPAIALVVALDANLTAALSNTASVTSTTSDPNSSNNSSTALTSVTTSADLSITKTHAGTLLAGTSGTYTFSVANAGPSDAATPTVTDTLPAGDTFVSASGTGWICSNAGQLVTCDAGAPLATGTAATAITLVVAVASNLTSVANTADVTSTTPDPVSSNNSSTDSAAVATSADLSITKTNGQQFYAGRDAHYTLSVANAGPSDALAPTVTDTLPAGETFVSASGTGWTCSDAGQLVTCTSTGPLAANSTGSPIDLDVALSLSLSPAVTNTASVQSTTPDPVSSNNSATDEATVISADLSITKTLASTAFVPGTNATYTLVVANAGPYSAAAPTVTDTLPAGETFVSATGNGWACSAAGQVVTCDEQSDLAIAQTTLPITLIAAVAPGYTGAALANSAAVTSATPDPVPANNTSSVSGPVAPSADLSIVKTNPQAFVAGTTSTYDLRVLNAGPSSAQSVVVTDHLPAGESYVAASGIDWVCSASGVVVTCENPVIIPNSPATLITLTTRLASSVLGTITNIAAVTSATPDLQAGNNSSTDVAPVSSSADLSITQEHRGAITPLADTTYQLRVKNLGPSDAQGVKVRDALPRGETYLAARGAGWTCGAATGVVTCERDSLSAHADAPAISLRVTVAGTAYPTVSNTARVSSTTPDPRPRNNVSTVVNIVKPLVNLGVTVTPAHTGGVAGTDVTYTIGVTNSGPTLDPGHQRVTLTLPSGAQFLSAGSAEWPCVASGSMVTCTRHGDMPVGYAAGFALRVRIGSSFVGSLTVGARVSGVSTDTRTVNNLSNATIRVSASAVIPKGYPRTGLGVHSSVPPWRDWLFGALLLAAAALWPRRRPRRGREDS